MSGMTARFTTCQGGQNMAEKENRKPRIETTTRIKKGGTEDRDLPVNQPITLPEAETPARPPSGGADRPRRSTPDRQNGNS